MKCCRVCLKKKTQGKKRDFSEIDNIDPQLHAQVADNQAQIADSQSRIVRLEAHASDSHSRITSLEEQAGDYKRDFLFDMGGQSCSDSGANDFFEEVTNFQTPADSAEWYKLFF